MMDPFAIAGRLNKVRHSNGVASLKSLVKPSAEPAPCKCEPISLGCKCGRFKWEMAQKQENAQQIQHRWIATNPSIGDVYIIERPPGSKLDHASIPFNIWALCKGQKVEVLEVTESVVEGKKFCWCWCDVSIAINVSYPIGYWFPQDSLLQVK